MGYPKEFALEQLNARSKDVSRGVMQWDDSNYAGFSTHRPWSGVNHEEKYTVMDQESDPNSILHYYRAVLKLKQKAVFIEGEFKLVETNLEMYCYERIWKSSKAIVCCNMSENEQTITIDELTVQPYTVALSNEGNTLQESQLKLSPYGAVVILIDL